jgi:hypothetical protein
VKVAVANLTAGRSSLSVFYLTLLASVGNTLVTPRHPYTPRNATLPSALDNDNATLPPLVTLIRSRPMEQWWAVYIRWRTGRRETIRTQTPDALPNRDSFWVVACTPLPHIAVIARRPW